MKAAGMHVKSDSDATSLPASSPPRSPRRPLYYVQSPALSQNDPEKMSYASSPFESPRPSTQHHFQYPCSPIHHSRQSSASRFSTSLNNPNTGGGGWSMMHSKLNEETDGAAEDTSDAEGVGRSPKAMRLCLFCFLLAIVMLFTMISLILWAVSLGFRPTVIVESISFENFKIQAGMDATGVPTDMLTLNSTVKVSFENPATFFGVHVTSTPLELRYFGLKLASGNVRSFLQGRKSSVNVIVVVEGHQVPLYGGIPLLMSAQDYPNSMSLPLSLTFVTRSRAYIVGRLVKTKFYQHASCQVTVRGNHLRKPLNLTKSEACVYRN